MKIIRIFSFLLLLGAALLAAAGKAEPVEVLRQDALAELRAFAAKWPQGNAARGRPGHPETGGGSPRSEPLDRRNHPFRPDRIPGKSAADRK